MKVFRPVFLEDNLIIIQILTGNGLQSHTFKQEFEAFKFYNSFKENEIAYKHYAVIGGVK
jgi:hypothetical protein